MKWFADFSRRHIVTACLILAIEIVFYRQYANLGAEFHFWIHGLFGATLGIGILTMYRLCRPGRPQRVSGWEAGFLGHVYSAIPDIIFVVFGVLHMYWMDVFALHISIHFIPNPVVSMLVVFLMTLAAYGLTSSNVRRPAVACLVGAFGILAISFMFKEPVPSSLNDLRSHNHGYTWLCPMWDILPANS